MATASTIFGTSSNHGTLSGLHAGTASGQYIQSTACWKQVVKYIILDKEVEVAGYTDPVVAMYISMINLSGKKFYDEVKKQGVNFPNEIEEFLQKELIPWERNRKLDIIL